MSLLFIDGFDHYSSTEIGQKWTNQGGTPAINTTGGRRSSGALELNAGSEYVEKVLAATVSTIMVGCAIKISALSSNMDAIQLMDGASVQVKIRVRTDGKIEAFRDTTSLGVSGSVAITANTYAYLEVKSTISDAAGTVTVKVNGTSYLTLTSQDTKNTANAYVDRVRINCDAAVTMNVDDLYIADTAGSAPQNDLLGDVRVDTALPTSDGTYEDFSRSTGTDSYALVDDTAPDGDSTYVQSTTVGAKDSFLFPVLPDIGGATIFGVQVGLSAKKDSTGTRKVRTVTRPSGGGNYYGSSQDLAATYGHFREILPTNPLTGAAWAEVEMNAVEFGMEVAS